MPGPERFTVPPKYLADVEPAHPPPEPFVPEEDFYRRLVRIETRLCRLMSHFGLEARLPQSQTITEFPTLTGPKE